MFSISKAAFNGVIAAYPEQNDIIMTNMLLQYGLTRDGDDTGGGAATQGEDEASAQMREDIIVCCLCLRYDCHMHAFACASIRLLGISVVF